MKHTTIALLLFILPTPALAQNTAKPDPLVGHYIFGNSAEIIHFTQSTTPRLVLRMNYMIFDLKGSWRARPGTRWPIALIFLRGGVLIPSMRSRINLLDRSNPPDRGPSTMP